VRRELIERYIGLVHHHAIELSRRTHELELDELVSAGTVGLIQALEGFDLGRNLAFSTYALPRIRGAMLDELRRHDWTPRTVRGRLRLIEKARHALRQRFAAEPGEEQIAAELGVDLATFRRWSSDAEGRSWVALDTAEGDGGDPTSLHEVLSDPAQPPLDAALLEQEQFDAMRTALAGMPDRDRLVLTLSYFEGLSLREIGEVLHITESRVSQVRTRALKRMREALSQREAA
jgi:RNA polymerase sigma factor for flagellar operon FliA